MWKPGTMERINTYVYLSVRTPAWITTRHGPYGYPIDWTIFNYDHLLLQKILPTSWISKIVEEIYVNPRFSHSLYNIHPKHGVNDRDPTLNDGLPSRMMNGSLILKKNIKYFAEDGIVFEDEGDKITQVDTVVLGTGYRWEFPFLDPKDFVVDGNKIHLYKCVFPPHMPHHTLGIIGFVVPLGPGVPCSEMQCRWASRVFSGKCKLPSQSVMMKDIDKKYKENMKRFGELDTSHLHVDFVHYLDDLASKIGAKPSLLKLFFTDFWLFIACTFKVFVPYRYRLIGPHKWNGARDAILSAGQRMRAPLQAEKHLNYKIFQGSQDISCFISLKCYSSNKRLKEPQLNNWMQRENGFKKNSSYRWRTYGTIDNEMSQRRRNRANMLRENELCRSKEMGALSDFPPKENAPNYMHNKQVHDYLMSYAKAFDLLKHINLNKEVVKVDLADDYDETGRLKVVIKDLKTLTVSEAVYDGVCVNIGHHVYPNMPSFKGMETFKGKVMHTHSLKKVSEFDDKVVVVVGVGNSGMDAAVEISGVASQVYLSTRRGAWVVPRVGPWGLPLDIALQRRYLDILFKILPYNFVCWVSEKVLNERFDHSMYNLKPEHRIWSQHATISDSLPIKLLSGTVLVRKNIREFVENGVIFENDKNVTECDAVVFATGYKIKFPFLCDDLTTVRNNEVHLYKYIFPPHMKHPTLAILGLIQVVGAGFPVGEAQARWASLVMNGKLSLPSKKEMEADVEAKKEENRKRYTHSERHTIQADYIPYLDEITTLFGAKPNLFKIFFTDPMLFWNLWFGPSLPYQYRLQGPHPWPGARRAILDWKKRIVRPLKSDYNGENHSLIILKITLFIFIFAILIAFFLKDLL
ncbi:dimethylaniline monooxygenase 5 [Nephila pilipes]|uniref:Flavin-containing monooxygenase n=1 Tax=Nephila pilipes TaxID=299642 RepID=A0A8X6PAA4_NEPPI|nr:dimethylaniline monooxygenase 5 [Nephila pilipes]